MDDNSSMLDTSLHLDENTGRAEHTITTLQKYTFIMNALEKGWRIKKRNKKYIFTKKHKGKKTFFMRGFLEKFITENILMTENEMNV